MNIITHWIWTGKMENIQKQCIPHLTNLAVNAVCWLPLMFLTIHDEIMNLTVPDLLLTLASKLHFLSKSYSHSSIVRWYANYELWTVRRWRAAVNKQIFAFQKTRLFIIALLWKNGRMRKAKRSKQRPERREKYFFIYFFLLLFLLSELYYNNLIEWNGSRALWFLVRVYSAVYCLIQYFSLK